MSVYISLLDTVGATQLLKLLPWELIVWISFPSLGRIFLSIVTSRPAALFGEMPFTGSLTVEGVNLMYTGPCIIVIVEE